jgi:hypothetical protein
MAIEAAISALAREPGGGVIAMSDGPWFIVT